MFKYMDKGREYDLIELHELRRTAKNSFWRDKYDGVIYGIMSENSEVRSLRTDLIKAVRSDDIRSIKRINWKLRQIRASQTYGKDY